MTNRPEAPAVSLVVPVFNEAESLPVLAEEIRRALAEGGAPYEVIFVDDGSADASPDVLQRLAAADPAVRVVRLERNRGQSAALAAGFRRARGEVVVTLDADLQNDPADIPRLLAALEGWDVVSGVRAERRDSWLRRVSSRVANRVRSRVLADGISDIGCSLKAYRTELLRRVPVFDGMHRFLPALLQMEGARVRELPVAHRPRRHGEPKYNIRNRLWRGVVDLWAVRWMQKRWIDRRLEEEVTGRASDPSGPPSPASAEASEPAAAGRQLPRD